MHELSLDSSSCESAIFTFSLILLVSPLQYITSLMHILLLKNLMVLENVDSLKSVTSDKNKGGGGSANSYLGLRPNSLAK